MSPTKEYRYNSGPGIISSSNGGGGASHGGLGGDGNDGSAGPIYGSNIEPVTLGSGGGSVSGGSGGGAVKLDVAGNLTANGDILANAENGVCGGSYDREGGGGGSGGSIWLSATNINGSGYISTNGGSSPNCYYDGGGGGGGRIAIYSNVSNTIPTENITSTGGTSYINNGTDGLIKMLGYPINPINLNQYKSDGITAIGIGANTNEDTIVTKFQIADSNETDTLIPEVEIQPLGTSFNNVATHTGTEMSYTGTNLTASISVESLADNTDYHWQARVCDSGDPDLSLCSEWVSAGGNLESEADVSIVMNADPSVPVIPESSAYRDGAYTNMLQPTFGYVLSDPNSVDSVGYQIQIATDSEFNSVVTDYISAMGAQGSQYFTVGQAVGDGTYNTGAESQELTTGSYYWRVKAIDDKGGESDWATASGTPSFIIDLTIPDNATNVRMKAHSAAVNEYTEEDPIVWFNRNDLYFEWDAGSDTEGVKGYCLYLGDESTGNPATQKGLLGSSPVSTSGSTCDFITSDTHIDFANTALRGTTWLSSSNSEYYFKVKTIDIANNVYDGEDTTNYISFKFDNTPPENVTAISAPSSTFSATSDMYFSWPITEGSNGSDLHSGKLGFQYALNNRDTWYGDTTDPTTGLDYYLLTTQQPFFLPESIQSLIQIGQNTIYFRILDQAGNASELRTVYLNYGGEAPKFAEGTQVTVTPETNTENSFEFSWPDAIITEGYELDSYYYMINTQPPTSYDTITSNSAKYIPITETSVSASTVPGLIKGSNYIYVVAVDSNENYSPSTAISATFTLDTELPDPPSNLILSDSSIKDASIWRAAIIWDEPEYKGTGTLTYHIQRSEDGETWEDIESTTGRAYVDTVPESKQYYWRVGTSDNSDESINSPSYSTADSITPRGKYTEPARLTSGPATSSITTTKATLSWTTHRESDSKVAFGLASGNYLEWEPSMSAQTTEHVIPLSNLKPGTEYFYVAKWTDEDGNTGMSEEQSFVTEPPPDVKEVRVSNLGISSTIINFTTVNATRAKIYYGPTTSFGGMKEIATSKLETSYSIELDNLEDGTKYFYRINTFDEEGEEYLGTILDFETLPRPRVSNVLVQQVARTAQSTLLVSWESNTEITSVITFYPENNPEMMQDIVELDLVKGEHKMLVKGLLPDTNYILRVRGKDAIGNEAVSENMRVTTSSDTRPPKISEMNIESTNMLVSEGSTNTTNSQMIVTWTTDEPATSQVEYGEGSSESYTQLTQEDRNLAYNHVVVISGLTPSKVYHLRAISRDSAGNETKSIDTVTITPKATNDAFNLVITTLQEAFQFLDNLDAN